MSSPCHLPSRVSRAPMSKYPVAMSNAFAMLDHSSKYRSPVQPETLLSTMKSSRPLESAVMTSFALHPAARAGSSSWLILAPAFRAADSSGGRATSRPVAIPSPRLDPGINLRELETQPAVDAVPCRRRDERPRRRPPTQRSSEPTQPLHRRFCARRSVLQMRVGIHTLPGQSPRSGERRPRGVMIDECLSAWRAERAIGLLRRPRGCSKGRSTG